MTEIDPLDRESLSIFEKGHRLHLLVSQPGYDDLKEIFESIAITYEDRLINLPSGESDQLLRDLHMEAKVARSILSIVQNQVVRLIENSLSMIQAKTESPASYNNF